MYSKQALPQLLAALAMLSMAQASWLDKSKYEGRAIIGRQIGDLLDGMGSTSSPSSAQASSQSTSTSESTTPVPSTTTTSQLVESPTSASVPATTSPPSTPPSSSTSPAASSTPVAAAETTSSFVPQSTRSSIQWTPTTSSSPDSNPGSSSGSSSGSGSGSSPAPTSVNLIVSTKVEILTSTRSDGSKATFTSTTKTTSTPGLSSSGGETTGMTVKTRNTVIGVVVGVGGAVVLGALALVAWRIWGRKKDNEEHDVLMDYDMSTPGAAEKSERGSSAGGTQRSPFQSTLENYHQPSQVNASSNF
ncbi:hypothetical protein EsDP_00001914 [Epichloe bromicola]|uniref:Mid2 domain-containing protein n=1 Tax=Epichloe bromicola TaxID=79588 RepID=A0ABQ0CJP2_9HYPO